MPSLWITYTWADNQEQDVDFLAQELGGADLTIKLDRWNLTAGRRLWDQIADFITNPAHSDGWAIYATQSSLGSEACREELAYALDRALGSRNDAYPVIALFPGPVDTTLLPASLRVRLCVSTTDPGWKERIVAAVERRPMTIGSDPLQPFVAQAIRPAPPPYKHVLEFRPRAGGWNPFIFGVPVQEKELAGGTIRTGPPRRMPALDGLHISGGEGPSNNGEWWCWFGYQAATPTQSYYAFLREMPSKLMFGQEGNDGRVYFMEGIRVNE